ncbi:hypothetical protein MACJ_002614 [Theileria orientalis]|uniref:Uncharacterized protein n=1 Tax=Theileria orientalis TaxID=68886 RepID=A0A976QST7_THEOR|nr:hypothetical protein MACJ_002614 [Theileria orientalis]
MTSNKFVILLVFLTFYKHCVVCNPNANGTPDAGPVKTVFDLESFKENNYVITKSSEEPFSYKVIPKEGTLISRVKLSNSTVWKTPYSWSVESIIIKANEDSPFYVIVKVKDPANVATLMHFEGLRRLTQKSLVEHIHSSNIEVFSEYLGVDDIFNISSEFDLRYHQVKEEISQDGNLKNITITPIEGKFSSVVDDITILHSKEETSVESMILSKVNGENKLLLLNLVNTDNEKSIKYFSKDEEMWSLKEEGEYTEAYADNSFEIANIPVEIGPGEETSRFDLLLNDSFLENNVHKFPYATLKTLGYNFKKLEGISEGPVEISSDPMFNPVIYIYRGEKSWEFIEIFHSNSESDLSNKPTCYYVKEENAWNKVSQAEFFSKIKDQILSNLPRLKATEEQVKMIELIELEDNVERTVTDNLPFAVKAPDGPGSQRSTNGTGGDSSGASGGSGGDSGGKGPPNPRSRPKKPRVGNQEKNDPNSLATGGDSDDKDKPAGEKPEEEDDDETSGFHAGSIIFLLIISLLFY